MKEVKIPVSFRQMLTNLTDTEKGRLFDCILECAETEEMKQPSGNEKYIFPAIEAEIATQISKHSHRCQVNKANVSKRYESVQVDTNRSESLRIVETEKKETAPLSPKPLLSTEKEEKERNPLKGVKKESGLADSFDKFWSAYPIKQAKKKCFEKWCKLAPNDELLLTILKAVEIQKNTDQWKRGYAPHPLTWLNGERWEDEVQQKLELPRYKIGMGGTAGYKQTKISDSEFDALFTDI